MKNVIIAGSSGMIGGLILKSCVTHPDIASIPLINRKPTSIKSDKIREYLCGKWRYP